MGETLHRRWLRDRTVITGAALALLVIATAPGGLQSDDANVRFETAISWLDGKGGALREDTDRGVPGKDGRKYSFYNVTQSLVLASILEMVRLAHVRQAEIAAAFVYSLVFLTAVFLALWFLTRRIAESMEQDPANGPVVLLVATPLLHYARIGQEENILAACYAGLVLGCGLVGRGSPRGWLLFGTCCGLAVLTRVAAVPTVLAACALLLRQWLTDVRVPSRRPSAVAGLVPFAVGVAATAFWNWYRFGNPLESGYRFAMQRIDAPFFDLAGAPARLAALLISPSLGLFLYAPVLLAFPLALRRLRTAPPIARRLVRFGGLLFLVNLIFFSVFSIGDGGYGWGSRYLAAPLALLGPVLILVPWLRPVPLTLLVLSVGIQLVSVVLPTNAEDYVRNVQLAGGDPCSVWEPRCSGIFVRPGLAARALSNAFMNTPLPTIEQASGGPSSAILATSDYSAPSWWLVRLSYRTGAGESACSLDSLAGDGAACVLAAVETTAARLALQARSDRREMRSPDDGLRPGSRGGAAPPESTGREERACTFVVESGTDVRLVEGLADRLKLHLLCRRIPDGVEVSRPPRTDAVIEIGPSSRWGFAVWAALRLVALRSNYKLIVVQGYALAALAANLVGRILGRPVSMLICSPIEVYYRCRESAADPRKPFRRLEYWGLQLLARLNARLGSHYIVLSRYLGDVVRTHGAHAPIDVVPVYGVDLDVFSPTDQSSSSLRASLGLPTNGSIALFVAGSLRRRTPTPSCSP